MLTADRRGRVASAVCNSRISLMLLRDLSRIAMKLPSSTMPTASAADRAANDLSANDLTDCVSRDADSEPVGPGEPGIMWVRGDSNAPCYWNKPDKTAVTMRDAGWICTSDRFTVDGDGYYFFQGRAGDLVKISGQCVDLLEIELTLADHPAVRECAVLAVPMADRRMAIRAFVVPETGKAGNTALTAHLQTFVKQRLLPYKYPRIVSYVDALPKTGSGKIDRQKLKETSL